MSSVVHAVVPTIPQQRILTLVLCPIACVITYFRLYVRYKHGKLWWDDFWAFFASCITIAFVVAFMLHIRDPATNPMSQGAKVATYYFCPETFFTVVWTARISILYTVIRMSFGLLRRLLLAATGLFFICWIVLLAQVFWVCEPQPGWKESALTQCELGRQVAITLIVMDVICDTILIAAPIQLLWGARLQRALKLRLIAVFAATAIMTAVSLYHDYTIYLYGGLAEAFAANLETSVSLMVANLSVLAAFIFRIAGDGNGDTRGSHVVTIGGKGAMRARVTTFGGLETIVPESGAQTIKVQVDISHTDDRVSTIDHNWGKGISTAGNNREPEDSGSIDKIELREIMQPV